jgi:hypothetical protein
LSAKFVVAGKTTTVTAPQIGFMADMFDSNRHRLGHTMQVGFGSLWLIQ